MGGRWREFKNRKTPMRKGYTLLLVDPHAGIVRPTVSDDSDHCCGNKTGLFFRENPSLDVTVKSRTSASHSLYSIGCKAYFPALRRLLR